MAFEDLVWNILYPLFENFFCGTTVNVKSNLSHYDEGNNLQLWFAGPEPLPTTSYTNLTFVNN